MGESGENAVFRAPGDPAVLRRYFIRQVILPIGAVICIVLAAASLGLHWTTGKSDEVALHRQTQAVRQALWNDAEQLAYEQQSIADWGQLARKLDQKPLDKAWLDVEIGTWLADMFQHDIVFILSEEEKPLYEFISDRVRPRLDFSAAQNDLRPFLSLMHNLDGLKDRSGAAGLHKLEKTHHADVMLVAGRPAAVSVVAVGDTNSRPLHRLPAMVSVRFLDGPYFAKVAQSRQIGNLRYSTAPVSQAGEAMVEIPDQGAKRIGFFFWTPELPGTEIFRVLGPLYAGLLTLLLGIMALLLRSLWRASKQLSNVVVDLQASKAQAEHLAFYDVLTGLANRALFNDRLDQALARARRGSPCALLSLDLDRFKQVNDSLGHAAGDALIREFAVRLNSLVRASDTVARIGGDEFSILVSDTGRREDVEMLCERILAAVRDPFVLYGNSVFVGVSIGVVLVPEAGLDRGDLIRKADIALYKAKSDGRDRYRNFTPLMDDSVKFRAELEEELRRAIENGDEMQVYYQTEVGPEGKQIVGLEALLRWRHPTRGIVSPEQFIPIAEETGLIGGLGDFVLKQACGMASRWPNLFIAVNLSAVQFRLPDLAQKIIDIAADANCNPHQIELEITEGVLLDEDGAAKAILERLREAGFRIALDDFGTGYSSLSYLRRFKVDKIKIDRSFTQNLAQDDEAAAIVTSVVTLGHAMGLTVTAEGVESEDQMRLLSAAGCNELQGFLFSNPLPEQEITVILSRMLEDFRNVA